MHRGVHANNVGEMEEMSMEVKRAVLVLVDISGYTKFLKLRRVSLIHAEQIITGLLEAVLDKAEHPLTLNKFEGDAAFLYSVADGREEEVAQDASRQVSAFFDAFTLQKQEFGFQARACICDACKNVGELRLKAFLHLGDVAFKKIRQFEELAGEDVIVIHRLLKNSIPSREYVAMTEAFHSLGGDVAGFRKEEHRERYDDVGSLELKVFYPTSEPAPIPTITVTQGIGMFLQRNLPLLPRILGFQSLKKTTHNSG